MCIKYFFVCIHTVNVILTPRNRANYPRQYGNFFFCLIICWALGAQSDQMTAIPLSLLRFLHCAW